MIRARAGLRAENPASPSSCRASALSCRMSKPGVPNQGCPGVTIPLAGTASPSSIPTSASRSTARFAALRTRTSLKGLLPTKESCQGQICG